MGCSFLYPKMLTAARCRRCALGRAFVDAALILGEAIGVLAGEVKIQMFAGRRRGLNRILRDDAAIVFHFHIEFIARKNGAAQFQNAVSRWSKSSAT